MWVQAMVIPLGNSISVLLISAGSATLDDCRTIRMRSSFSYSLTVK